MLAAADIVVRLSSAHMAARVYPPIDVLASRSRLLDTGGVTAEHADVASRARMALSELWASEGASGNDLRLTRALKLQNFLTQPLGASERYTGRSGAAVGLAATLQACRDILSGRYDDLPAQAFFFANDMTEIVGNRDRVLAFGPVAIGAVTGRV
jgi:F0F1-type ATP synthase beta subunit